MFYQKKYPRSSEENLTSLDTFHTQQQTLYITTEVGHCIPGVFFYSNIPTGNQEENSKIIDCGTNEELFIAIAALRDNSDKYQYFVTEEEMH